MIPKLIECPRDAMQGIVDFIPTKLKADYINRLLQVGFDTIDFGSFVSPKAIPQMADTGKLVDQLEVEQSDSRLLAIVGNMRGANDAVAFEKITYLGFPFSVSEEFQRRNLNSSIEDSLSRVGEIQNCCLKHNKKLVVYISMGFGNPYGEKWDVDRILHWVDRLHEMDIKILALSDTIGVATPDSIATLFGRLIPTFPTIEFGAHFHTTPDSWLEKIDTAWKSGCRRFDGAIGGFGGCPMAKDELTGNMATENMLQYFENFNVETGLDKSSLREAMRLAVQILPGAQEMHVDWMP